MTCATSGSLRYDTRCGRPGRGSGQEESEPIDFRNVARTAGVSINFLYTNPPLRARIESLRAQQREATHPVPDPPESDTTAIVRVLTAKLKDERRRHRDQVAALRAELAATHGGATAATPTRRDRLAGQPALPDRSGAHLDRRPRIEGAPRPRRTTPAR